MLQVGQVCATLSSFSLVWLWERPQPSMLCCSMGTLRTAHPGSDCLLNVRKHVPGGIKQSNCVWAGGTYGVVPLCSRNLQGQGGSAHRDSGQKLLSTNAAVTMCSWELAKAAQSQCHACSSMQLLRRDSLNTAAAHPNPAAEHHKCEDACLVLRHSVRGKVRKCDEDYVAPEQVGIDGWTRLPGPGAPQ